MKPDIIIESNIVDLISKLAKEIICIIGSSQKEVVNVALSGGSTPKILYEHIAVEYSTVVDWNKVYFWWGDERCVAPDSDESNFRMSKEALLDKLNLPDKNIRRIRGEANPEIETEIYRDKIKNELPLKNGLPIFDIILLGLGEDGHTVSIFPNQIHLFHSRNYVELAVHPASGQNRITITGTVINNAENVFFLVSGKNKANTVYEILKKKGNYNSYPAYHVVPKESNFKWYLDSKAAKKL